MPVSESRIILGSAIMFVSVTGFFLRHQVPGFISGAPRRLRAVVAAEAGLGVAWGAVVILDGMDLVRRSIITGLLRAIIPLLAINSFILAAFAISWVKQRERGSG